MARKATILIEPFDFTTGKDAAKYFDFFGVPSGQLSIAEFIAARIGGDAITKSGLFGQAGTLLSLLETLGKQTGGIDFWQKTAHSALVYAGGDPTALEKLVRLVTGNTEASLVPIGSNPEWVVSDECPEFSKSLCGLKLGTTSNTAGNVLAHNQRKSSATDIISNRNGAALLRFEYHSVPIFISTCAELLDIHTPLTGRNFDIRQNFLTVAPMVMYIKWAFAPVCWQPSRPAACLVIDDPLLKPRYGFLNFRHFFALMRKHDFAASIAFIPWNWRRSATKVIQLFKESQGRFSLSIHGCDHTGGEFGSQDRGRMAWKSTQAAERMARHEFRTGLRHDRVMVFPQGVFSEAAIGGLKHAHFIGVVNTEVRSSDPQPRLISISDFWDVAVMNYGGFPIFTRRYPSDGIENFAFDILLGKPCLVVIHHNDCRDHGRMLMAFIDRLNGLNARLSWGNLTAVVQNSFRQRETLSGTVELEMYGAELRVSNSSVDRKRISICKREPDPSVIEAIFVDTQRTPWKFATDRVAIEIEVNPGESKIIRIGFRDLPDNSFKGESRSYRGKTMVRRFLTEFRDNYVTRKPFSD